MTIETVDRLTPTQGPGRIGQATAVEQSRAVAEVAAAVQVAQACPRSLQTAVDEMRRSCQQARLAERAFFRYSRGGSQVTGPSIHLARELARCWGNVQYGVHELRRDDEHGQSEMQAWAWDVQTNSRASTTFIVPHARDTTKGRKDLADLRDIYENNANNAARRLREMILGLLPQWFVEEAKDLATETLKAGNGRPLGERVAQCVDLFAGVGVSREQLEQRIGHPASAWTPQDLATLSVIFRSVQRGEIRVEDEFEADRITVADVAPAAPAPAPQAAAAPAEAAGSARVTETLWRKLQARLNDLGVVGDGQKAKRAAVIRSVLDLRDLDMSQLTVDQAQFVLDQLAGESGAQVVAEALHVPAHVEPQPAEVEAAIGEGHAADEVQQVGEYDPTLDEDWGAEAAAEGL